MQGDALSGNRPAWRQATMLSRRRQGEAAYETVCRQAVIEKNFRLARSDHENPHFRNYCNGLTLPKILLASRGLRHLPEHQVHLVQTRRKRGAFVELDCAIHGWLGRLDFRERLRRAAFYPRDSYVKRLFFAWQDTYSEL